VRDIPSISRKNECKKLRLLATYLQEVTSKFWQIPALQTAGTVQLLPSLPPQGSPSLGSAVQIPNDAFDGALQNAPTGQL